MRVILAAAAALAALTVSGCDIHTDPSKTAKVDCNCAAPAAPPAGMAPSPGYTPPAEPYTHHRYHGEHHGRGYARGTGHSYYWRREYAEMSVVTYDYHSDSHSYYTDGHGGHGARTGGGYRAVEHGWIDGYGRGHGGGATAGSAAHYETGGDDRARMHHWHGYDADCPDPDNR